MLQIETHDVEMFDDATQTFSTVPGTRLTLEHSLISISKWESKWHKSFLSSKDKTEEEVIDYIRCMTLTQNVDPAVYQNIGAENLAKINAYINDPMTATKFGRTLTPKNNSHEVITAEIIYYWMISFNIPIECQKWHINRLLTLIEVFNRKNNPQKVSNKDRKAMYAKLNAERRRKLKSNG